MKYVNVSAQIEKGSKPLAELFPDATVLFADIAGFTAWSSIREPSQVFILLESIFGVFDAIAKKKGVFKVETVGDCYVAVCGLPEPNKDHGMWKRYSSAALALLIHRIWHSGSFLFHFILNQLSSWLPLLESAWTGPLVDPRARTDAGT